jgi:hypothetical protein
VKIPAVILLILTFPVCAVAQNRYDVVIDEIMADPSPQVGLPNIEWIELKNTSASPISLQNWRIGDATGQSGPMPNFILQPDSLVIICTGNSVAAMTAYGTTIAVTSFPSLDNDGDQLYIKSAGGKIIHAVFYSSSWYQNELKKDGGWTLEMIDTKNPCAGTSNWKASIDVKGGTPGKKNSVDAANDDLDGPSLEMAYTIDSVTVVLKFDEPLDSLKAATVTNYSADGGLSVIAAVALAPLFDKVQLKLNSRMLANVVYHITASAVTDCKGNLVGSANTIRIGIPGEVLVSEIVINEILFNPRTSAYDYIEFYNRGEKIADASKLFAANRTTSGTISSIKQLSSTAFYIFPGDYVVVTESLSSLELNYFVKDPAAVLEISSLPSYPDDEGDVILLNSQGNIVDEVKYKDDWHFKLIDNAEGVSLERIDPGRNSQDSSNWHSAASTAGYGTPTGKNSQYRLLQNIDARIEITPKVFSPDNDGRDDFATIRYRLTEPGYVANIVVFDALGRVARHLVQNSVMGIEGYWNWDGLDDKGAKLSIGTYIIFTEIFNLAGKKQQFKSAIVLARKLN